MTNIDIMKLLVGGMFLSVVICNSTLVAASDDPPSILVQLGERVGCHALGGKVVAPSGVATSWIIERELGVAYAAWCIRQSEGNALYDLLVTLAEQQHPWAQCTPHIMLGLPVPFPQLRAMLLPRDLPYTIFLKDFWYVDENWLEVSRFVGGSGVPEGPAIDVGDWDAG